MTKIQDGRINGATLQQYVRDHREQTPEVAEAVRDCSIQIVDYVKRSLAGEREADPRQAFRLMDELRDGLTEVRKIPTEQLQANQTRGREMVAQAQEQRHGAIDGQGFELVDAREVHRDGEFASPEGTGKPSVYLPETAKYGVTGLTTNRYIDSTIHYGAESVAVDSHGSASYRDKDEAIRSRQGLGGVIAQVDTLNPLVQAALSNRALRLEEVANYSETQDSSSHVASFGSSDVEAHRKLFGRGTLDASQASGMVSDSSSHRSIEYTVEPALVEAFRGLQTLRNSLETLSSYPAMRATVRATVPVREEVQVETTTAPPRKAFQRHHDPIVATNTLKAQFDGCESTGISRTLGTIPWVPYYIDAAAA